MTKKDRNPVTNPSLIEAICSSGYVKTLGPDPLTVGQVRKLVEACANDGHTIWPADKLAERAGCDVEQLASYADDYQSGDSPKSTIHVEGERVDSYRGVYTLDFLSAINRALGLPASSKWGRGFQATEYTGQVLAALKDADDDNAPFTASNVLSSD